MMDRDSADLLAATARRDAGAFRILYERHGPKMFGIALRVCGDRSAAEDALQEAFAEIWQRAGDYDPARGRPETWLNIIARSRAIDVLRRRARVDRHTEPGDPAELLARVGIDDLSQARPEFLALVQCLTRLEPKQRQAVLLAYYKGWSREQLADHFDQRVNTVKSWLRRSLAALKSCLDE